MAAFVVISLIPNAPLGAKIVSVYPTAHLPLTPMVWLVSDVGVTTKDVCDKIDIKADGFASAVVVKVESYFGFASPHVWEWLKTKTVDL
jgi:hypothetical protein